MSENEQTHEFQAEVGALLRLVTHSLYTNSEIFLRELISNASDALDKARFQALVDTNLRDQDAEAKIRIVSDRKTKTLTIEDTGIGLTPEEAREQLGTIAHSGTRAFLEKVREQQAEGESPDLNLIGQFGVGFYSAFMVADEVEVHSLSAKPDAEGVLWASTGDGTFRTGTTDRKTRGTRIVLKLRESAHEFLEKYRVESVVKRYSNYVGYPIEFTAIDDDGKGDEEPTRLNDAAPLWARSPKDISDEDYNEFYRHAQGGFVLPGDTPLAKTHLSLEAPIQFQALLFVPSRAPADLFMEDRKALSLYARRILVIENCDKLLPPYLRFFKGVVDSEDLPLNVSREMLQEHKSLAAIRRQLTRKALRLLTDTAAAAAEDKDTYNKIWSEFGAVIKEGVHTDNGHRDELLKLLRYVTDRSEGALVSLDEYVDAMPEGQDAIYYISGEDAGTLASSPHLERCKADGHAVLLMTDAVDEWVVQALGEYRDKKLVSVTQGEEAEGEDDKDTDEHGLAPTVARAKEVLGDRVADVRVSKRLKQSASCLVDAAGGLSKNMERILRMSNHSAGASAARVLEVNPEHSFVKTLDGIVRERPDDPRVTSWVELLWDQANLAEGEVPDPAGTVARIQGLLDQVARAEG